MIGIVVVPVPEQYSACARCRIGLGRDQASGVRWLTADRGMCSVGHVLALAPTAPDANDHEQRLDRAHALALAALIRKEATA